MLCLYTYIYHPFNWITITSNAFRSRDVHVFIYVTIQWMESEESLNSSYQLVLVHSNEKGA